jgi:DnaJ-class molecular chaperone
MYVRCETCYREYDDEEQWTTCPHGPLGFGVSDYCLKCDTLKTVHGPCRHQQEQACGRCEGDGKAHGSDRPFEWTPEVGYPGPCPVCHGTGRLVSR